MMRQTGRIVEKLWPHAVWDAIKELIGELVKPMHAPLLGWSGWLSYELAFLILASLIAVWLIKRLLRRYRSGPPQFPAMHPYVTLNSRLSIQSEIITIVDGDRNIAGIAVRNLQDRYENTCHDVRAEAVFTYAAGEVLKIHLDQAQFLTIVNGHITKVENSLSLELAESAVLALIDQRDSQFFAVRKWPADVARPLRYGEWRVQIRITSDADEDHDERTFFVQLRPSEAAIWRTQEGNLLPRALKG
jgi:hypothetical protein